MKVLIFSDLHGHPFREFAEDIEGVNSRLIDQIDVINWIKETAVRENVKEVWNLGDLFHLKNYLDSLTLRLVLDSLAGFPVTLRLLQGNHDYRQWDRSPEILDFVKEHVSMMSGFDDLSDVVFCLPYRRNVDEVNTSILGYTGSARIFLGHQDIIGVQYGGFVVEKGVDPELLKKFSVSFIGHNHSPFTLRDSNVWSVGAPLQHTFGDMGSDRRILIFDTQTLAVKSIKNTFSPQFKELIVDTDDTKVPEDTVNFYRIIIRNQVKTPNLGSIRNKRIIYESATKRKDRTQLSFSDSKEDLLKKYVDAKAGGLDKKRLVALGESFL